MRRIVLALLLVSSATPLFATDPIVLGPYQYDGAGNIRAIGTNESFLYDGDSRLVNAVMIPGTQTFKYDTFGNRTFIDTTPATTRCNGGAGCKREPDPGTLSRTNRIAGATYNAAGAIETMDGRVYTYEPTGMMTSQKNTQLVQYVYTADDERIAVYTNSRWEWSLRDPGAHVIRQVTSDDASTSWSWLDDQIFRAGSMLASERPLIGRRHFHLDHLGTPRLITTDTGTIAGQYEYYAFGTLPDDGSPRETPTEELKFTGHQRDLASGDVHVLDYMHARYYDGAAGRFMSLDPDIDRDTALNPQKWNRYAYVQNNPLNYGDPDGKQAAPNQYYVSGKGWKTTPQLERRLSPAEERQIALQCMVVTAGITAVTAAPSVLPALLTWALSNPNQATEIADTILSPPGSSTLPVSAANETLEQAAVRGTERLAGFSVDGTKGLVGTTFNRNILYLGAESKGAASIGGLLKTMESEAKAAGAARISIVGHAVGNEKLFNAEIAKRYGYTLKKINDETIQLVKELH